jgi:hypothetical protein
MIDLMKIKSCCAFLLLVFFCHVATAEASGRAQEPEYIENFFLLDSNSGKLTPLERQTAESKFKVKAFGLGGGESSLEFQGEKSPVRFREGRKLKFVIRVSSQQTDPQEIIQFYSLKSKKGTRKLVIVKAKSMGLSSKSVLNERSVAFNATKYGQSSFMISPAQNLPTGEYMLGLSTNNDGYCFGIDGTGVTPDNGQ